MARPRKGEEHKYVPFSIRVSAPVADRLCRLSLKRDESVYSLAGKIVERVVTQWIREHGAEACYPASSSPSSTLSGMLSESPSSRASRAAEPVISALGRR